MVEVGRQSKAEMKVRAQYGAAQWRDPLPRLAVAGKDIPEKGPVEAKSWMGISSDSWGERDREPWAKVTRVQRRGGGKSSER